MLKEVLFILGIVALIFVGFIGAFIGGIIGCVVGAIGIPMMILDGQALNPIEAVTNLFNGPQDHI